ncbi:hypothetical protein IPL68_07435 [Candidatus Saccharibacteria bacterium]|nr:MAG: hypothetical protein IPL68_07435 [Candidatus Saccharibacteria bacterium]
MIGFVDNHHLKHVVSGVPVLGKLENIPELVKRHNIQTIYFADSKMSQHQKQKLSTCSKISS